MSTNTDRDFETMLQSARIAPLMEGDRVIGVITVVEDVTERAVRETELRESEAKCKELADSIADVFFAFDKDLRYTYWNKASEELTGIAAKDAIGKSLHELFPDTPETGKAERVYLDVLRTQQLQIFVNEYQLGGKDFFFELSVYPSKDGISVFAKDITERKQAEEKIEGLARFPSENPNPVLRVTGDGVVIYANEASQPLLSVWGCQVDQPLPKAWNKVTLDALSSGSIRNAEVEYKDRILSLTFAPVVDADYVNGLRPRHHRAQVGGGADAERREASQEGSGDVACWRLDSGQRWHNSARQSCRTADLGRSPLRWARTIRGIQSLVAGYGGKNNA